MRKATKQPSWLTRPSPAVYPSPNNLEFGYMSFFGKITCEMYDIPSCKQSQQRLQGALFNFFDVLCIACT